LKSSSIVAKDFQKLIAGHLVRVARIIGIDRGPELSNSAEGNEARDTEAPEWSAAAA
jgi:hypothetical protein|tara:strand:+ start:651 stop:821 length:171 start_codon:yes stop_codon:yes gene_type:complete